MTSEGLEVDARDHVRALSLARVGWLASVVCFGVLPAFVLVALFTEAVQEDVVAYDFRVFYGAAEAILRGDSPYQSPDDAAAAVARGYVYPPLAALGAIPFTVLNVQVAGLIVMALLVAAAAFVPLVLGVRDWRCYGLLFLWPPVISAIQTGSVTIPLALAAALAWRFRNRSIACSMIVAPMLALKLFLWPLLVWLVATKRAVSAALSTLGTVALVTGSWALIGFSGITEYPSVLERLRKVVELDSYTAHVVALDAGASQSLARGLWLAVGLAVLGSVVVVALKRDAKTAFVLAIASALALTPIVWLHYFALLLVVVSLAQPRLGAAWFVPLAMVVTPGSGQPTPFETSWTLAVAVLTFAVALHGIRRRSEKLDLSATPSCKEAALA